ncbi:hypothetical protein, partial [Alistipes shahii]|uniref:hypothetical protein n=1 Tax=Alistipes shahii TaxID=328814 RepID=UPI003FD8AD7A
ALHFFIPLFFIPGTLSKGPANFSAIYAGNGDESVRMQHIAVCFDRILFGNGREGERLHVVIQHDAQ